MSTTTHPMKPYKGLVPYSEEDQPFFFGRESEREIITANLRASRLTLLYGTSGVGKSSVLRAGVAHHLNQVALRNLAKRGRPELAVVVFSSWRDDPIVGLTDRVRDSVPQVLKGKVFGSVSPTRNLTQTLQAWTEHVEGNLLIILDQFEEYFLYHPQEDGDGTFAVEFPRAVNRPDVRVNFLISIREDALAKLDRFKGRIPNLFDNYLRIDHLDRKAAREAIEKPIDEYNRRCAADDQKVSIGTALVDTVLDQVKTGQVILGEAGRGVAKVETVEERIETPYLQLVMTRLWDEEMRVGSHVLTLETLNSLGGAEHIVKTHLDETMNALPPSQQDIAAGIFRYLVTPSGTKIAHTVPDLADYAKLPQTQLTPLLETLSGGDVRILRTIAPPPDQPGAIRYEIFHDVLAPAILDWRRRAEAEKQLARERQRAKWLLRAIAFVFLVVVIGIGFNYFQAKKRKKADAYTTSGLTYYYKGEYDKAIDDYNRAIKLNPGYADAYFNRGNAYYGKGKYDQAIADYNQAIDLNPDYALAYMNLGLAYYYKGDYDRAIDDYNRAIELDSNYADAYINRGVAFYGKGKYDQAIADYNQAIKLNPNYALAYMNRGLAYYYKGDYDQAIADYNQAIKLNPDYVDAYNNLSYTYLIQNELEKAVIEFEKAIRLDPKNYSPVFKLGLAYALQGRADEARARWRKGLVLLQGKSSPADKLNRVVFTVALRQADGIAELQKVLVEDKPPIGLLKDTLNDVRLLAQSPVKAAEVETIIEMLNKAIAEHQVESEKAK